MENDIHNPETSVESPTATAEPTDVAATTVAQPKKKGNLHILNYPKERMPAQFTGPIEKAQNLEAFTEFYMENKIDPHTGKAVSVFRLIVMYNDLVKPKVPFWPAPHTANHLNMRLKKALVKRAATKIAAGKDVVLPSAVGFSTKPYEKKIDTEILKPTLEERADTLADDLIASAQSELYEAASGNESTAIALKRKAHALGVFSYISRHVHKKREVDLKAKDSKIGEASFLLDIMGMATAGKLDESQLKHLEASISNEPQH